MTLATQLRASVKAADLGDLASTLEECTIATAAVYVDVHRCALQGDHHRPDDAMLTEARAAAAAAIEAIDRYRSRT